MKFSLLSRVIQLNEDDNANVPRIGEIIDKMSVINLDDTNAPWFKHINEYREAIQKQIESPQSVNNGESNDDEQQTSNVSFDQIYNNAKNSLNSMIHAFIFNCIPPFITVTTTSGTKTIKGHADVLTKIYELAKQKKYSADEALITKLFVTSYNNGKLIVNNPLKLTDVADRLIDSFVINYLKSIKGDNNEINKINLYHLQNDINTLNKTAGSDSRAKTLPTGYPNQEEKANNSIRNQLDGWLDDELKSKDAMKLIIDALVQINDPKLTVAMTTKISGKPTDNKLVKYTTIKQILADTDFIKYVESEINTKNDTQNTTEIKLLQIFLTILFFAGDNNFNTQQITTDIIKSTIKHIKKLNKYAFPTSKMIAFGYTQVAFMYGDEVIDIITSYGSKDRNTYDKYGIMNKINSIKNNKGDYHINIKETTYMQMVAYLVDDALKNVEKLKNNNEEINSSSINTNIENTLNHDMSGNILSVTIGVSSYINRVFNYSMTKDQLFELESKIKEKFINIINDGNSDINEFANNLVDNNINNIVNDIKKSNQKPNVSYVFTGKDGSTETAMERINQAIDNMDELYKNTTEYSQENEINKKLETIFSNNTLYNTIKNTINRRNIDETIKNNIESIINKSNGSDNTTDANSILQSINNAIVKNNTKISKTEMGVEYASQRDDVVDKVKLYQIASQIKCNDGTYLSDVLDIWKTWFNREKINNRQISDNTWEKMINVVVNDVNMLSKLIDATNSSDVDNSILDVFKSDSSISTLLGIKTFTFKSDQNDNEPDDNIKSNLNNEDTLNDLDDAKKWLDKFVGENDNYSEAYETDIEFLDDLINDNIDNIKRYNLQILNDVDIDIKTLKQLTLDAINEFKSDYGNVNTLDFSSEDDKTVDSKLLELTTQKIKEYLSKTNS